MAMNFGTAASPRNYTTAGYNAVTGAGAQASKPGAATAAPAAAPVNPSGAASAALNAAKATGGATPFLGGQFGAGYAALGNAVKGYGDMAGEDFTRGVGQMLGQLNSIGGLRSGGVQAGIDQASKEYGRQIGDYSSMEANNALQFGESQNQLNIDDQFRQKQYEDQKAAQKKSWIGKLIGGGLGILGTVLGGPVGGAAGGALGGMFGGSGPSAPMADNKYGLQ